MLVTCVIGILATPLIVYSIATGLKYDQKAFDASVIMTRIMFPYIGFMSFVALAGGILNTWREFKIPAFTSVLLNVFIRSCLAVCRSVHGPADLRHGICGVCRRRVAGSAADSGADQDRHVAAPVSESDDRLA